MYYEIYVDTLFLVNFVMNLYLLMLANVGARRTATRLRIIGAAAVGAIIYVIGLWFSFLPPVLGLLIQGTVALILMIKIAFRPCSIAGYKKMLEMLMGYSLLVGGAIYILMGYVEGMADRSLGIAFIMGVGGLLYMFCSYLLEQRKTGQEFCRVILHNGESTVEISGLWDTGNGLVEPISGKPVSVVNKSVLEQLWPAGLPELFRIIPYHSVGKEKGIMKAYFVESMLVELDGIPKSCKGVYVAAGDRKVSGKGTYEMILNPMLFDAKGDTWENGGIYDIKSSNAGGNVLPADSKREKPALSKTGRCTLHRRQRGASATAGNGTGKPGDK